MVTRLTVYRRRQVLQTIRLDEIEVEKIDFPKTNVQLSRKLKNIIKNYVCVCFRPGGQLAETAPVLLGAGGKPSTWLPPGRLVEHQSTL